MCKWPRGRHSKRKRKPLKGLRQENDWLSSGNEIMLLWTDGSSDDKNYRNSVRDWIGDADSRWGDGGTKNKKDTS